MPAGAPLGNQNATKSRPWQAAIQRALEKRSKIVQREELDEIAEKFLNLCAGGDMVALKELGDRLDGKAHQSVEASGDMSLAISLVRFGDIQSND